MGKWPLPHNNLKQVMKNSNAAKKSKIKGNVGGEINELGYGTLEAAKVALDQYHLWNQEELELVREHILKSKRMKVQPTLQHRKR